MSTNQLGQLLSSLVDPSFGIHPDVTFQVMDYSRNEGETETVLGEVKGHKMVLGMFSPVFKREFFGPAKETKDIIPVRQTTLEAFERMFDFIYQKGVTWEELSVLELYDVVNLAEKYDICGLMEEIKTNIENLPLTMEDVMETADTAVQFTQFPEVSNTLLLMCAKFLKTSLNTPAELLQFATDQSESGLGDTVLKLLALVREIKEQDQCLNCRQEKCQNGKQIAIVSEFVPGLRVATNRADQYLLKFANNIYTVVSVTQCQMFVNVKCQNGKVTKFHTVFQNRPTFCYKCK